MPGTAGNRCSMKIPLAFLADEANISQEGKLNVLGIFDRISAAQFPVVHPRMVFCFRVQMDFGDSGRSFPVQVLLLDGDNGVMFEAAGEITAPSVPINEFATANQVFALVGVQFPREGTYRFVVAIGGEEPYETPFLVHAPAVDPMMN
jgi:hypothetical protein